MTDLEMTKLCAEAMGYKNGPLDFTAHIPVGEHFDPLTTYRPLNNDKEAMALIKRLKLVLAWQPNLEMWWVHTISGKPEVYAADLNRAIVECVANMQAAKSP